MTSSPPSTNKRNQGAWIRWVTLSLLLGAATMALISRTEKQEREIAIAVTFNNLADNVLLMDAPRHSVRLLVSGTASTLHTLEAKNTSCRLDLSGLAEGTHTLTVRPANVSLPAGVTLKSLLTPSLTIRLETLSQKKAEVTAILEGQPAPGFAVAAVSLQPNRILLKGTMTMLADITTVDTRPINLEDASESFKKEVPLNLPEAIVVEPPLRFVVAHVEIKERIITRVLESIPVSVRGASAGFRIHPDAIALTVKGPEAIVKTIETNPAFGVTVDLSDLTTGSHSLKAVINLPVGATLVRVSPEHFSVTISR
jgi:YbbR domain-containing protein